MENKSEIVIYKSEDGSTSIDVKLQDETVWLNQQQMAKLFDTSRTNVVEHIRNIYNEGELDEISTCRDFRQVQKEGNRNVSRNIPFYNLDMIISLGYRVKTKTATDFRVWATHVLKDYMIQGYAVNDKRLEQLGDVVNILKRAENQLDAGQVLDVVSKYQKALTMLDDYDHQRLAKPKGNKSTYVIDYDECKEVISKMRFNNDSELFGTEKDDSFKGAIGNIYQSFGGEDVYPSTQEKAANLLYFLVKDHCFLDGNKRIAATLFLYFLDKNNALYIGDNKIVSDVALAALTIMIAESNPTEKDTMIVVIMNCLID